MMNIAKRVLVILVAMMIIVPCINVDAKVKTCQEYKYSELKKFTKVKRDSKAYNKKAEEIEKSIFVKRSKKENIKDCYYGDYSMVKKQWKAAKKSAKAEVYDVYTVRMPSKCKDSIKKINEVIYSYQVAVNRNNNYAHETKLQGKTFTNGKGTSISTQLLVDENGEKIFFAPNWNNPAMQKQYKEFFSTPGEKEIRWETINVSNKKQMVYVDAIKLIIE